MGTPSSLSVTHAEVPPSRVQLQVVTSPYANSQQVPVPGVADEVLHPASQIEASATVTAVRTFLRSTMNLGTAPAPRHQEHAPHQLGTGALVKEARDKEGFVAKTLLLSFARCE
jgi:hypothetical protein